MQQAELTLQELRQEYSAEGLEQLFLKLDRLHDYASQGQLGLVSPLQPDELRGWLEELIFTARETIREMENS